MFNTFKAGVPSLWLAAGVLHPPSSTLIHVLMHVRPSPLCIMQVVCEAIQNPSAPMQVAAFECFVQIMSLYYENMGFYMEWALFRVGFSHFYKIVW